ncbi:hypothetical protein GCK72_025755 [Caenorhabditis remanei]|uniref:Uncharacterized protein n=1 Tax=Caenorhabditis remanei TaxID=31234 RepID=A0A6A5G2U8_CAERE|nr:hypothetical protein GCK72_025755 [Caenorhabditis remanei]KAF1749288.1 hypothetical protein GCK72_025755 [Caenorhabditis remanei]
MQFYCLLLLAASALAAPRTTLTDDQIFRIITKTCESTKFSCPKQDYLIKDGNQRYIDEDAVMRSDTVGLFKDGKLETSEVIEIFKTEFCCTETDCLKECNIFPIKEKPIVKNFDLYAKDLFAMDLEELKPYEKIWYDFVEDYSTGRIKKIPAEVEELFDILDANERRYMALLGKTHNH